VVTDEMTDIIVLRCMGCTAKVCAVRCAQSALSLVSGSLLIDVGRCDGCSKYAAGEDGVPACVAACPKSDTKILLATMPAEEKRQQAAEILNYCNGGAYES
jgi:Fe-S-cluster-containing hydrogenase component 2